MSKYTPLPEPTETKVFACMAEAVAEYFNRGFETIHTDESNRIMITKTEEVWLRKIGFLNIKATVISR